MGIKGTICVAAAGVMVGLLLAPEKGKELRGRLRKKFNEFTESLNDHYDKGKEKVESLKEKGRDVLAATESKLGKIRESLS